MSSSSNKYTQQSISDQWTRTDANGQTYLGDFIAGMNGANKLPAGFIYAQKHNPTFINWHTTIVSGIYDWHMFLSAGVIPRKSGATYWLTSWNIVSNGGHYISLYGYLGLPEESARWVYYSDTAGQFAQSTAKNVQQGSYAVYQTMMYNNGNMVY